jgi:hypothetical protein
VVSIIARDITDLKGHIQNRHKAKPLRLETLGSANSGQANNNLLSFPYGVHFKKRKRTCEKPIKLRLSEARAPEKAHIG